MNWWLEIFLLVSSSYWCHGGGLLLNQDQSKLSVIFNSTQFSAGFVSPGPEQWSQVGAVVAKPFSFQQYIINTSSIIVRLVKIVNWSSKQIPVHHSQREVSEEKYFLREYFNCRQIFWHSIKSWAKSDKSLDLQLLMRVSWEFF